MPDLTAFDFVDFGCSGGGSLRFAMQHLGGVRGLGIDIDPEKVERTRSAGFEALRADLTIPDRFQGSVRFSILSHFLEHLPSAHAAVRCLNTALAISSELVYVQQPWFDSDDALRSMGLKLYWSDWQGHSYRMTMAALLSAVDELRAGHPIHQVVVAGRKPILDSSDGAVHPSSSPPDQHEFDPAVHPPKPPPLTFPFPVYRELVAVIAKTPLPPERVRRMLRANDVLHEDPPFGSDAAPGRRGCGEP